MEIKPLLPYLFFVLGVIARVVVPYVQARLKVDGPLAFDWRYLVGQLVTAVIALIPLLAGQDFVTQLGAMGWIGALVYGWGAGDIGNQAQKSIKPVS